MKKILMYFIFSLMILFIGFNSIDAYKCEYPFVDEYSFYIETAWDHKAYIEPDLQAEDLDLVKMTPKTQELFVSKDGVTIYNWDTPIPGVPLTVTAYMVEELCPEKLLVRYVTGNTMPSPISVISNKDNSDIAKKYLQELPPIGDDAIYTLDLKEQPLEAEEKEQNTEPISCLDYTKKADCKDGQYFSCMWNKVNIDGRSYSYCSSDNLKYLSCGTAMDIPYQLPGIISFAVTFLKVITPIILIFVSIISLLKALASSSEDEIKKAQNSLIKKMIAAALVFFVVTIVQFVIFKVAETNDKKGISACMSCFLNNDCSGNIYYKTNVSGQYVCKTLGGTIIKCKK